MASRRAMIEIPNMTESRMVSVVVCIEVSVWKVLIHGMGAERVGI